MRAGETEKHNTKINDCGGVVHQNEAMDGDHESNAASSAKSL